MSAVAVIRQQPAKLSPAREHLRSAIAVSTRAESRLEEARLVRQRGQVIIEETAMVLAASAEAEGASTAELSTALANWARTGGDRPNMKPSPALVQARAARAEAERQHQAALAADEALAADVVAREEELKEAQKDLGQAVIAVAAEEGEALGTELEVLNERARLLKHSIYSLGMNRNLPTGTIGCIPISKRSREAIGMYSPPGGWDSDFPAIVEKWSTHLKELASNPAAAFTAGG